MRKMGRMESRIWLVIRNDGGSDFVFNCRGRFLYKAP